MTATSIWDPRFLVFADRLHHWFRRLVEEIIEPEMAEFFGCGEKEKKGERLQSPTSSSNHRRRFLSIHMGLPRLRIC